jgi:hypothetical protein
LDTGGLAAVGCCPADSGFAALEEKGLEIRVKREEGRETGQKEERKVGKAERRAGARKAMKNTAVPASGWSPGAGRKSCNLLLHHIRITT